MRFTPAILLLPLLLSGRSVNAAGLAEDDSPYSTDCKQWRRPPKVFDKGTIFRREGNQLWASNDELRVLLMGLPERPLLLQASEGSVLARNSDSLFFSPISGKAGAGVKGLVEAIGAAQKSPQAGIWGMRVKDDGIELMASFDPKSGNAALARYSGILCRTPEACALVEASNDKLSPLSKDPAAEKELRKVGYFSEARTAPLSKLCTRLQSAAYKAEIAGVMEAVERNCGTDPRPKLLSDDSLVKGCALLSGNLLPQLAKYGEK